MNFIPGPAIEDIEPKLYKRAMPLIAVLGAVLILGGVWSQPPIPDDVFAGFTAIHYVESGQLGPTMWHHPCLRSLLIYATVNLFGANWLGVKASSILMGILCIPLVGALALRLTGRRDAALFASFLWAVEPLAILYSRQAVHDIYLAFFPLAGILSALRWLDTGRARWMVLSGAFFGLGLASKWSVAAPLAITAAALLGAVVRRTGWAGTQKRAAGALVTASLAFFSVALYTLTFIPWFANGHSLGEFASMQKAMAKEAATHKGYLPFMTGDHEPWKWFLVPVSYENFAFKGEHDIVNPPPPEELPGKLTALVAQGDPLVWLLFLPSAAYLLWRGVRERSIDMLFLAALFLGAYLPLLFAGRPVWVNTAMTVLPFAIPAVAFLIADGSSRLGGGRRLLWIYSGLTALAAIPLYLLVTGLAGHLELMRPWVELYYPAHFLGR